MIPNTSESTCESVGGSLSRDRKRHCACKIDDWTSFNHKRLGAGAFLGALRFAARGPAARGREIPSLLTAGINACSTPLFSRFLKILADENKKGMKPEQEISVRH
ncbi:MAG TPA: hypothetical protein VGH51_14080, partial [Candidatus Angelobacter sp.]